MKTTPAGYRFVRGGDRHCCQAENYWIRNASLIAPLGLRSGDVTGRLA